MHTPAQEAIAQLMFWGSIGSLPLSVVAFVMTFRAPSRFARVSCAFVGGALLTQFLWYFVHLGVALSDKVGGAHYPFWWHFAFVGFGIALVVMILSGVLRHGTSKT